MKLFFLVLVELILLSVAFGESDLSLASGYDSEQALNGTLGSCSYQATCSVRRTEGVCVSISAGCCSGTATSGLCPGNNDIKCCTNNKCNTPYGSGTCMQTSQCRGKSYSGYCTGPKDLQCCVTSAPNPSPTPNPPSPTSSDYGVDVSAAMSSSTASCMAKTYSFVIPRGYRSSGSVDTNVCTTLNNAKSAGIKTRDVYMFPCPTCSASANSQMAQMVDYINQHCKSSWSGRAWLDIEGSQYWKGSSSANQAWYKDLVDSCSKNHVRCGVYSSSSQWSAIFGSTSFSYGSSNPLWYAHYDGKASFSDFSSFGGWHSPHAKQYAGDTTSCSMGVDKNYSPNF